MGFLNNKRLTGFKSFCVNVLKQGPIPRHVAIIMDGNRRFAQNNEIEQVEGHSAGFMKLLDVLSWCRELGINELTVYAFSIENFKRSQEEVDNLLNLVRTKFDKMWEERETLMKSGCRVRAIGNLLLFPKDLQLAIAKVIDYTKDNDKYYLNVAIAYTGREEIFQAFKNIIEGVHLGLIEPDDITEDVLQRCLYTYESPDPDILIRTSDVVRLSDFLLWQTSYSVLVFIKSLWPVFSLWEMLYSVFIYQRTYYKMMDFKNKAEKTKQQLEDDLVKKKALEKKLTCANNNENESITESDMDVYKQEKANRLNNFYLHLEKKRCSLIKSMLLNETHEVEE